MVDGIWENTKGIPPLRRQELSKNHKRRKMKLKKTYNKLIVGVIIVNSSYIVTIFNGLIQ